MGVSQVGQHRKKKRLQRPTSLEKCRLSGASAIKNLRISVLSAKLIDARLYTPQTNRKEIEQK